MKCYTYNMFKRKCKITFIRHGSTIYSDENRLNDSLDYPPLNELGKIEAQNISQWVKKRSPKVDKIYSSADLKSIQTAKYIAKEYNMEFEIVENLQSRKAGLWNKLTFEQIEVKYPDILENYHNDNVNYWAEGGETTAQLANRIKNQINELISLNKGKRIIIVTNGDTIQTAISTAVGIPLEHMGRIYIPCGSATQISYYSDWSSLVYSGHVPIN